MLHMLDQRMMKHPFDGMVLLGCEYKTCVRAWLCRCCFQERNSLIERCETVEPSINCSFAGLTNSSSPITVKQLLHGTRHAVDWCVVNIVYSRYSYIVIGVSIWPVTHICRGVDWYMKKQICDGRGRNWCPSCTNETKSYSKRHQTQRSLQYIMFVQLHLSPTINTILTEDLKMSKNGRKCTSLWKRII